MEDPRKVRRDDRHSRHTSSNSSRHELANALTVPEPLPCREQHFVPPHDLSEAAAEGVRLVVVRPEREDFKLPQQRLVPRARQQLDVPRLGLRRDRLGARHLVPRHAVAHLAVSLDGGVSCGLRPSNRSLARAFPKNRGICCPLFSGIFDS